MAFDELYIANRMLIKVGAETMSSFPNKLTKTGRLTQAVYDGIVFEVFGMNIPWKFATTRAQLIEITDPAVAFGWDHQFALPELIVRNLGTVDEQDDMINYPYKREMIMTVANNRTRVTPVYLTDQDEMFIRYVVWLTDPASWPGWFQALVIAKGAKELLWSVKKDDFKSLDLRKELEDAISAAKGANGSEDMETGDNLMDLDMGNTDILNATDLIAGRTGNRHRFNFRSINRT
ncbi:hypothetical protein LCGC14_2367960 [marine sediment metagenome]|uniref:Uncharacterized protein n=1 Tax=marine sediment metagenome TaxID=412755 RepID=A0A0F9EH25_9ZZZZ